MKIKKSKSINKVVKMAINALYNKYGYENCLTLIDNMVAPTKEQKYEMYDYLELLEQQKQDIIK